MRAEERHRGGLVPVILAEYRNTEGKSVTGRRYAEEGEMLLSGKKSKASFGGKEEEKSAF